MSAQRLIDRMFSQLYILQSSRILALFTVLAIIKTVACSYGDRSYIFMKCLSNCGNANCTSQSKFFTQQTWYLWLLQWSCKDECRYECMWKTVDAFQKDGSGVPQFYGKWPFVRFFGIQEPASVLFSILNGVWHLRILTYRKLVPSTTPMYYIWHIYALIGFNAWFWSTVFHAKDTEFTEKMDYFCAFSLVLSNYYAVLCRLLGTTPFYRPVGLAALLICWYAYHVYKLAFIHFDYGYNMNVNVLVGVLNFVGWIYFAYKEGLKKPYVQKCVICMFGLTFLVLLELLDFPPLLWTLDAHAMWHAGTAPLCYLWYSFVIEDGMSLAETEEDTSKKTV